MGLLDPARSLTLGSDGRLPLLSTWISIGHLLSAQRALLVQPGSEKWVSQEQQSPGLGAHPVPQVRLCAVVECSQQMSAGSRLAGLNPAGGARPEALDPGLGALGADLASALWEKLPPCAHPQTGERRA